MVWTGEKAALRVAEDDTLEDGGCGRTAAIDAVVDLSLEAADSTQKSGLPPTDAPPLDVAP